MSRNTSDATMMKSELDKAFKEANSVAEKIEIFQNMVSIHASRFQLSELATYCWSVFHMILQNPTNTLKVYKFAKTALSIANYNQDYVACLNQKGRDNFDNTHRHSRTYFVACVACLNPKENIDNKSRHSPSYFVACVYELLGRCCYHWKRFGECLRYLNLVDSALQANDNSCGNHCVKQVLIRANIRLHNIKVDMGKRDEAIVHAKKTLDLMKLTMDENSIDLCKMYSRTYNAYVAALDAKRAIPLCKKALEICRRLHPEGSSQVTELRVDLAALYRVVGKPEKVDPAWLNTCPPSELREAQIKEASILSTLGRQGEAFAILQAVILPTDVEERITSLLAMAKVYYRLTDFNGDVDYMTEPNAILRDNGFYSNFAGKVWLDMSGLYILMNDEGNALHWSKKVCELCVGTQGQNMLDQKKLLAASCKRLFSLTSVAGLEDIQFMNSVAEKLEQVFGQNHREVGYGYARWGYALMTLGEDGLAVKWMEKAMKIMNGSLGLYHMDSLQNMVTLSQAYLKLGDLSSSAAITDTVNAHSQGLEPDDHKQCLY